MKNRPVIIAVLVILVFAVSGGLRHYVRSRDEDKAIATDDANFEAKRIISRAPSVTETLFAMGLGNRVVGATPWCDYPEAAAKIPRTGGLLDPNYERILQLEPDLVIMTTGMTSGKEEVKLNEYGIRTMALRQKTIGDTLKTIRELGRICDAQDKAARLLDDLEGRMKAIREQTKGQPLPRVLVVIGREHSQPNISTVHIAGNKDNLFNDMLLIANARNAYDGDPREYPELSVEHLIRINPEVIIEATGGFATDKKELISHWQNLSQVDAVKNGRIYIFSESYEGRPGPRFILTLEKLAATLHPRTIRGAADGQ